MDDPVDAVDAAPGDGVCATLVGNCTLRAAVGEANALAGEDEVILPAGDYFLESGELGSLDIRDDLDIIGADSVTTVVQVRGIAPDVPLRISQSSLTLRALTFTGSSHAPEGVVHNQGTLTLDHSLVSGHVELGIVGGILNEGTLIMTNSTVAGTHGDFGGIGALFNLNTLTVSQSAIRGSAFDSVGGLVNAGDASIADSTVNGSGANGSAIVNSGVLDAVRTTIGGFLNAHFGCPPAATAGGVSNSGTLRLTECSVSGFGSCFAGGFGNSGTAILTSTTVSGSSVFGAGAIGNRGSLVLRNCTISNGDSDTDTGGLANRDPGTVEMHSCTVADNAAGDGMTYGLVGGVSGSNVTINDTIIATNRGAAAADCQGSLLSLGHNIIKDSNGCTLTGDTATDVIGVDPMLGPLADNGGTTMTHALLPQSIALDRGSSTSGPENARCEPTDQRGVARPQGAACDVGAYEAARCGDGTVGPAEECDDGNTFDGDCCSSTCRLERAGSPCQADGNSCTTDQCDGHGQCLHSNAPRPSCRAPGRSSLAISNVSKDTRDSFVWKWQQGPATAKSDFGNPLDGGSTSYRLCVYENASTAPSLLLSLSVPGGGLCTFGRRGRFCWRDTPKAFKYGNATAAPYGIYAAELKAGTAGKARIVLKGRGPNLHLPSMPLAQPLIVQLTNSNGVCWAATYSAPARKNTSSTFKDIGN